MLWNFDFNLPTTIDFGNGKVNSVGGHVKNLGGTRVLIVTDKGLAKTDILNKVSNSLRRENISFFVYDQVKPNPRDVDCQNAYEHFKDEGIDLLIGLGGGSSMDTAKAIGTLLTNEGRLDIRYGEGKLDHEITPLICIPTTAGTGSEVTSYSVITDTKNKQKMLVFDLKLAAKVAILDPELTVSLPKSLTAGTGMDALTHAIESYVCNVSEPITDGLALYAVELITEYLPQAVEGENNLEARKNMLAASLIAGIAFSNTNLGSVHSMAESLGGLYDTPHGVSNAIFLPFVYEFNISSDIDKFAEVSKRLGVNTKNKTKEEIAYEGVDILKDLSQRLEIPTLKELGYVNTDDFDSLAKESFENICTLANPKEITIQDYINLFDETYKYKGTLKKQK